MNNKRSWRTTLAGILAILGTVLPIVGKVANGGTLDVNDISTAIGGVAAGVGLIKAKDAAGHGTSSDRSEVS